MLSTWILLFAVSFGPLVLAQYDGCYAPDGKTLADNETIVPCNKLGIYSEGVQSSCCRLDGDEDKRDRCTTRGLCQNIGDGYSTVRRGFCTDKTWQSDACINICTDPAQGGSATDEVILQACDDGSGTYCCGQGNSACCGTDAAVTLPTIQASVVDDGSGGDVSKAYKDATIALAVIVGVLFLASGSAIAWLMKKLKSLKQQRVENNNEVQSPPPPMVQQPYQDTYQESAYQGTPQFKNSSVPASPGMNTFEMQNNMARYSELDAASAARSEMGSPVQYSDHGLGSPRSMSSFPHSPHPTS
ncbi:hypothetical protein F5Y18DRAFT_407332 [Xylariaceae sp. FL1019]|nr:hypothetical protein F5Y18DRAFT_407332 [Xylariaceae sp. FL1019]